MMHEEELIDDLLDKIEQLKAERDAAVRELELVTAERNRAHRACEQISVRLHAAMAERDALRDALEVVLDDLMYKDHARVIDFARATLKVREVQS